MNNDLWYVQATANYETGEEKNDIELGKMNLGAIEDALANYLNDPLVSSMVIVVVRA